MKENCVYEIKQYVKNEAVEGGVRQKKIDALVGEDTEYHAHIMVNTPNGSMNVLQRIEAKDIEEAFDQYELAAKLAIQNLQQPQIVIPKGQNANSNIIKLPTM